MKLCPICSGSNVIRVPVRTPVTAIYRNSQPEPTFRETSRTYPCPECNGGVAEEKVSIIYARETVLDDVYRMPEAIDAIRVNLAHSMVDKILKDSCISFHDEPRGDGWLMMGRLGVVSPKTVETIERRALEKMKTFLAGALDYAAHSINIWGSAYGCHTIKKDIAVLFVSSAFERILEETESRFRDKGE